MLEHWTFSCSARSVSVFLFFEPLPNRARLLLDDNFVHEHGVLKCQVGIVFQALQPHVLLVWTPMPTLPDSFVI